MELLLFVVAVILLDVLAHRFGADSRDQYLPGKAPRRWLFP